MNIPDNQYWHRSAKGGLEFFKDFYDLSFRDKCRVVAPVMDSLDTTTMERLVKALLQHSPSKSKKSAPVMGERKLSPIARAADLKEQEFANR